jgi:Fe-S-cluster containining protein
MFTHLEKLFQFVDQTVESICTQHPQEVHCHPGCADCCHAVFDVSFIEAAYIASFLRDNKQILTQQKQQAEQAAVAFEKLVKEGSDPSTARIRCPFLSEENLCLAHSVRPVNCRTYGTPTIIDDKGAVCGLSGFSQNGVYPTVKLVPLQDSLKQFSCDLVGEDFGGRRFPLAWVVLRPDYFLPPS